MEFIQLNPLYSPGNRKNETLFKLPGFGTEAKGSLGASSL